MEHKNRAKTMTTVLVGIVAAILVMVLVIAIIAVALPAIEDSTVYRFWIGLAGCTLMLLPVYAAAVVIISAMQRYIPGIAISGAILLVNVLVLVLAIR